MCPVILCLLKANFNKKIRKRWDNIEKLTLSPKITHFHHGKQEFPLKIQNPPSYPLLTACYHILFQKNLRNAAQSFQNMPHHYNFDIKLRDFNIFFEH